METNLSRMMMAAALAIAKARLEGRVQCETQGFRRRILLRDSCDSSPAEADRRDSFRCSRVILFVDYLKAA